MKKITLIIIVSTLMSCKKTRTCECTEVYTDNSGTQISTYKRNVDNVTKKQAESGACSSFNQQETNNQNVININVDCKLK